MRSGLSAAAAFAPSDFFDRDLPAPGAIKLELRGAGSGELAVLGTPDGPAGPIEPVEIDPLTAPLSAGAGGPNGSTLVAAVETACMPARSSRTAAEVTLDSSIGACVALRFAFAARTAAPRVLGYKSITSCGGFVSREAV